MARGNRVAGIVASALLFGAVSGGTMVGVNVLADQHRSEIVASVNELTGQEQKESTSPIQKTVAKDKDDTSSAKTTASGEESVSKIAKDAMSSVVSITNTIKYQQNGFSLYGQGQTREAAASGSGVIIGENDNELLIVTNKHVVEDSTSLSVQFVDGKSYDAEIKGTDSDADLAVVSIPLSSLSEETKKSISYAKFGDSDGKSYDAKIKGTDSDVDLAVIAVPLDSISADTKKSITTATFGDSDALSVGDQVVAIGNALGYGQSVTTGIISAKDRDIQTENGTETGLLQTDAAINPGNSGGALLNMQGELIGINVAKYSDTTVEGMGYSIPAKKAQEIVETLSKRDTREKVKDEERGYIGIQGKTVDSSIAEAYNMPQGIYVYKILKGDGIDNSALQEKDIITKFDGQGVRSLEDLVSLISGYKAGEKVEVTVKRLSAKGQYEEKTVEVTLGKNSTDNN